MYRVVIFLAFASLGFCSPDIDVAAERDGGGHGHGDHHGDHHNEHHEVHHQTEHNEVHNSGAELPKEHRAGGPIETAIYKLEQQFFYLLRTVTDLIDPAVRSATLSCEESAFKTRSYGMALLGGGVGDTLADFYGNNRVPGDILTMPDVQYSYGFNLGYGVGFAAPFLLPSYVPSCSLSCSSTDFLSVARTYGLSYGLAGQDVGESKICNFGLDAKQALSCLEQNRGDSKEAVKVLDLIDDMVEAGVQRNRLQKRL